MPVASDMAAQHATGHLACVLLLLLALQGACARQLFGVVPAVAPTGIRMSPSPAKAQNAPCHIDVAFSGNAKYRKQPCDNLELVAEAVEVILAFATGMEPSQVCVPPMHVPPMHATSSSQHLPCLV